MSEANLEVSGDVSEIAVQLLKIKCIFLLKKEAGKFKNINLLKDLKDYSKGAKTIDVQRILLTIVKRFTEMYFEDVERNFQPIVGRILTVLGDDFIKDGVHILKKCLIILEKRMFENLYDHLSQEPWCYSMILNTYNFETTKSHERYSIREENIELADTSDNDPSVEITSINIFELIKFVYYNAIIDAKKEISRKVFKRFLDENLLNRMIKDNFTEDNCDDLIRGKSYEKMEIKQDENKDEKLLKVAEYLIKSIWEHLPVLKSSIVLREDALSNQLAKLMDENIVESGENDSHNDDNIDWNYIVSIDGETVYVNAPTYKLSSVFVPGLVRAASEAEESFKEEDFSKSLKKRRSNKVQKCKGSEKKKQIHGDIFEKNLDQILGNESSLVGEILAPGKSTLPEKENIWIYNKIRVKEKKQLAMKKQLWKVFQKKYFTFEEPEENDTSNTKCIYPIRPQEFFDMIPQYLVKDVRPIEFEFEKSKYICAACGLFIQKGTGVSALGHKWHDEHFKCRVCCEQFKDAQKFMLYKGIVLCEYDADVILNIKSKPTRIANRREK